MQIRITHRAEIGDRAYDTFVEIDGATSPHHTASISAPIDFPMGIERAGRGAGRVRIAADGTQLGDGVSTPHVAVLDEATGLMWAATSLGDPEDADGGVNHERAAALCADLDLLGHRDWRLPTRAELAGLVDDMRHEPAIDTALFPGVKPRWHWSTTPTAWSSAAAWGVDFYLGDVSGYLRDLEGFALAVRRAGQ